MITPAKALLFATALMVEMSGAGSAAQAANEKWLRSSSGKIFSTARGPGVLKSVDEGRTWTIRPQGLRTTPTAAAWKFRPTLLPGRPVKVY